MIFALLLPMYSSTITSRNEQKIDYFISDTEVNACAQGGQDLCSEASITLLDRNIQKKVTGNRYRFERDSVYKIERYKGSNPNEIEASWFKDDTRNTRYGDSDAIKIHTGTKWYVDSRYIEVQQFFIDEAEDPIASLERLHALLFNSFEYLGGTLSGLDINDYAVILDILIEEQAISLDDMQYLLNDKRADISLRVEIAFRLLCSPELKREAGDLLVRTWVDNGFFGVNEAFMDDFLDRLYDDDLIKPEQILKLLNRKCLSAGQTVSYMLIMGRNGPESMRGQFAKAALRRLAELDVSFKEQEWGVGILLEQKQMDRSCKEFVVESRKFPEELTIKVAIQCLREDITSKVAYFFLFSKMEGFGTKRQNEVVQLIIKSPHLTINAADEILLIYSKGLSIDQILALAEFVVFDKTGEGQRRFDYRGMQDRAVSALIGSPFVKREASLAQRERVKHVFENSYYVPGKADYTKYTNNEYRMAREKISTALGRWIESAQK